MLVLILTLPRNNQGYGRNKFKLHQSKKKKKKKESYLIISMLTMNFWPRVIVRLPRIK